MKALIDFVSFSDFIFLCWISVAAFIFLRHHWYGFVDHPTVRCLMHYQNSGSGWRAVAKSINAEYRNTLDMLSISLTGWFIHLDIVYFFPFVIMRGRLI